MAPVLGLRSAAQHAHADRLGAMLGMAEAVRQRPAACDYQSALNLDRYTPSVDLGNLTAPNCVEAGNLWQVAMRLNVVAGSTWLPTADEAITLLGKWGNLAIGTHLADAQRLAAVDGIDLGFDCDVILPVAVGTDPAHLDAATWLYGSVGLCWALPAYLQDRADTELWDVAAPGTAGTDPGSWGLHYTASGRYCPGERSVISWGREPVVTPTFAGRYLVGACAGLSRRWFDATGHSPSSLDWTGLDAVRMMMAA